MHDPPVPQPPARHGRFERELFVVIGDDDSSGLVFFASIFRYASEFEQEALRLLGWPTWEIIATGKATPVVHASCDYLAPARTGDRLAHTLTIRRGQRSSMRFEHTFENDQGTITARALTIRSWVDLPTMRSEPLPDGLALQLGPAHSTDEA